MGQVLYPVAESLQRRPGPEHQGRVLRPQQEREPLTDRRNVPHGQAATDGAMRRKCI